MQAVTVTRRRRTMRLNPGRGSDLSWQQGIRAIHEAVNDRYGYVESSHLNRQRMSVRGELPEVADDMQPVYRRTAYRTTRQDRLAMERAEENRRVASAMDIDGVRASIALAVAAVLLVVLLICWTTNTGRLTAVQNRIDQLSSRIAAMDIEYNEGKAAYEQKVASVDVGYAAVSQGLISSVDAQSVKLYVPADAVIVDPRTAEQAQRTVSSRR